MERYAVRRRARGQSLLGSLVVPILLALPAGAALEKFSLQVSGWVQGENVSPNPDGITITNPPPGSVALIDSSGPAPVLRKLLETSDDTVTVVVPQLVVALFRFRYISKNALCE